MKSKILLFSFFIAVFAAAQPGTINMTAKQSLNLQPVQVEVPSKFSSLFPSNRVLYLPPGYKARVFFASSSLSKPRFMSFSPSGVLHVADYNTGMVTAIMDSNADGIADSAFSTISGLGNIHDVRFYDGAMYVTQERKVYKCEDANNDGIFETKTTFIDTIAEGATQPGGGHRTRTIAFDSINQKVYLSIGSYCNVCRETYRAIIEEYNIDGTGKRTFATGVRNAVGMAIHPKTNQLWANNNGSDNQGSSIPPEWVDIVREGGFYGYPFAHSNQVWFNFNQGADYQALKPITAADSFMVSKMVEPAALVDAHSAPMAIQFLNNSFPVQYRNGFLMALRGSWNSSPYKGYKIVYLDLSDATDTTVNFVADFCSGFLTDSVAGVRWARPVGLAADNSGNIYMSSDDINRFILQIYRDEATGISEKLHPFFNLKVQPNPSQDFALITFESKPNSAVSLQITDLEGRKIRQQRVQTIDGVNSVKFDMADVEAGIYFVELISPESRNVVKLIKE